MPSPQVVTDGALVNAMFAHVWRVAAYGSPRDLEVALTPAMHDKLEAFAKSRGWPKDAELLGSREQMYGMPLVIDENLSPHLGDWAIRPAGSRINVVHDDQRRRAAVGHGEGVVSLIVTGPNGVGSMTLTPDQARSLAVLLIEQAGHAANTH